MDELGFNGRLKYLKAQKCQLNLFNVYGDLIPLKLRIMPMKYENEYMHERKP
jgi:hypothetical protein